MHSPEPQSTPLETHLQEALEAAEDGTTKYHLREALQKLYLDGSAAKAATIRHSER